MIDTIAVLIATYRRPELLDELLASIETQSIERTMRIIVVDNDDGGSAEAVCSRHANLDIVYCQQTEPGIVPTRNATLDLLQQGDDAMVFVDDDKVAECGWLEALVAHADETGADIVTGPVLPRYSASTPQWIIKGGMWDRQRHETGALVRKVATNNTLLRVSAWRSAGAPRFDMAFNESGGSDRKLFSDLRRAGLVARWCDEAVVREEVLPQRANFQWLARRAMRNGNNRARRQRSKIVAFGGGAGSFLVGGLLLIANVMLGRGVRSLPFRLTFSGLGMLGNTVGLNVYEYRRPPESS